MQSFVNRMLGTAKLDVATFEEVEADRGALGQAAAVVVLSAIAAGIGAMLGGSIGLVVMTTLAALVGWVIWAALTWVIGTKLLPEPQTDADLGQMMRTIGFAASPGILRIGGIIPGLGWLIVIAAEIWMLVAMIIGVRQALDYRSTWRAVGVCVIGWIIQIVIVALMVGLFGGVGVETPGVGMPPGT